MQRRRRWSAMMAIDVEALIEAVRRRPAIWDRRNQFYANRVAVDRCWTKISQELGRDEDQVKRKWKYLRDQFASEWAKIIAYKPEAAESFDCLEGKLPTKWQFFAHLMFLKDVMRPRALLGIGMTRESGNYASPTTADLRESYSSIAEEIDSQIKTMLDNIKSNAKDDDVNSESDARTSTNDISCEVSVNREDDEDEEVEEEEVEEEEQDDLVSDGGSSTFSGQPEKKRKKMSTDEYQHQLQDLEEKTLLTYLIERSMAQKAEAEDYDLMFFKSILPFVRKIPDRKKLRFRSGVLELLEEFVYPQEEQEVPSPLPIETIVVKAEPESP